jgi:hypothetical protein
MYTKYVQKEGFTLFTEGKKTAIIETSLRKGAQETKQTSETNERF